MKEVIISIIIKILTGHRKDSLKNIFGRRL